jgi:hypothetical protein
LSEYPKDAKAAEFQNENPKELSYHIQQIKDFIALASKTQKKKAHQTKIHQWSYTW